MNRAIRNSRGLLTATLTALATSVLLAGCHGDGQTSFRDAFNALGDAFRNWIDRVF